MSLAAGQVVRSKNQAPTGAKGRPFPVGALLACARFPRRSRVALLRCPLPPRNVFTLRLPDRASKGKLGQGFAGGLDARFDG